MAKSFRLPAPQGDRSDGHSYLSTDTTGKKDIITGGTNGSRVTSLWVVNNDHAVGAHVVRFYLNEGATLHDLGAVNSADYAGAAGAVAATDVLALLAHLPKDPNGCPYIPLAGATSKISAMLAVASTGENLLEVNAIAEDY